MSVAVSSRLVWPRAAITALFVGNGALIGAWAANIPRVKDAHGLSDSALGALLLAVGIGAVAAMSLTSALAARVGPGRLSAGAGLLLALAFPFIAVVPDRPGLLLLAALIGALNGTMDVAMNAAASALERRRGGAIMSSFHAGWSIGGLGGAAMAGALASLGAGLTPTLAAAAAVVAVAALCGLALPPPDGGPQPRTALRLPSRRLVGVALLAALSFAAEGAVADWFGVYLETVVGTDAAWATTGYAAFALAMVAGRLAGDAVVARLGPVRVVWVGGALATLGVALALAWPDRWVVDAGLVLAGAGLANIVPAVFSAAGRMAGTGGVATAAATGYAALLVAPPLLGNVADAIGLRPTLVLVLACTGAILPLARTVSARNAGGA
jgi:predicted MFS family arabinose efflux permease